MVDNLIEYSWMFQEETKGYCLYLDDEGTKLLCRILKKDAEGEAERTSMNTMWGGQGIETVLKSGKRGNVI